VVQKAVQLALSFDRLLVQRLGDALARALQQTCGGAFQHRPRRDVAQRVQLLH
jgi:hypothetical protein